MQRICPLRGGQRLEIRNGALAPKDALALNNRGLVYAAKKQYARAIADYLEAIKINPEYAEAYRNCGIAVKAQGDKTRAEGYEKYARFLESKKPAN